MNEQSGSTDVYTWRRGPESNQILTGQMERRLRRPEKKMEEKGSIEEVECALARDT